MANLEVRRPREADPRRLPATEDRVDGWSFRARRGRAAVGRCRIAARRVDGGTHVAAGVVDALQRGRCARHERQWAGALLVANTGARDRVVWTGNAPPLRTALEIKHR